MQIACKKAKSEQKIFFWMIFNVKVLLYIEKEVFLRIEQNFSIA